MSNYYPDNDYRNYLQHSRPEGSKNKEHKFLFIKNGRYYYPGDVAKGIANAGKALGSGLSKGAQKIASGVQKGEYALSRGAQKLKTAAAGLSFQNRQRKFYRETGIKDATKEQMKQKKKADRREKLHNLSMQLRSALGNAKSAAKSGLATAIGGAKRLGLKAGSKGYASTAKLRKGIASLSFKNRQRAAYRQTGIKDLTRAQVKQIEQANKREKKHKRRMAVKQLRAGLSNWYNTRKNNSSRAKQLNNSSRA